MNPLRKVVDRIRRSDEVRRLQTELEAERVKVRRLRKARDLRGQLASRMVWVFGGGRSGTTWMASMLRDLDGLEVWFEPRVGEMFDPYHLRLNDRGGKHFFLSETFSEVWSKGIRDMILDGAVARFPDLGPDDYLVAKEPGGSVGAVTLMRALPESRILLLVRDPRDVVASWRDASKVGSWRYSRAAERGRSRPPSFSAENRAEVYFRNVSESKKAYDAHAGHKSLVRYEDLLADTFGELSRIFEEVGIPFDGTKLAQVVDAHSWERIPEDQKGEGKFYRKAKAEGWREDLSEDEIRAVEDVNGELMDVLGYERYFHPDPDTTA